MPFTKGPLNDTKLIKTVGGAAEAKAAAVQNSSPIDRTRRVTTLQQSATVRPKRYFSGLLISWGFQRLSRNRLRQVCKHVHKDTGEMVIICRFPAPEYGDLSHFGTSYGSRKTHPQMTAGQAPRIH